MAPPDRSSLCHGWISSSTTPLARTSFFPSYSLTAQTSATCAGGGEAPPRRSVRRIHSRIALPCRRTRPADDRDEACARSSPLHVALRFRLGRRCGQSRVRRRRSRRARWRRRTRRGVPPARSPDVTGLETFPTGEPHPRRGDRGELHRLSEPGTIERPYLRRARTVVANTGLPNVRVDGPRAAYVGSTRHFVIANRDGVWDIVPGASPRALRNQVVNGASSAARRSPRAGRSCSTRPVMATRPRRSLQVRSHRRQSRRRGRVGAAGPSSDSASIPPAHSRRG